MADPVTFRLRAAPLPPGRLPRALQDTQRGGAGLDDDPFLPRRLVTVDQALDLSAAARSTEAGRAPRDVAARPGQVMVLELPDGVTVITHPENLRDALARVDPGAVDADGAIVFEHALAERSAALRGALGEAAAGGLSSIVAQVYTLTVGQVADPIVEAARRKLAEWVGERVEDRVEEVTGLGVSWLGTKALMWAIESRLPREPGLYRWLDGELAERLDAGDPALKAEAAGGPLLVFVHGTASSTAGSFDALQGASRAYWAPFEARYGDRVFAFEHRTLSESPVDNALQLARALPEGATVHLVTHSRGGLVGDLLCLEGFEPLVEGYALDAPQVGEADAAERERVLAELKIAYAEQRSALHELAAELRRKKLRIERYVRVACPARGTRLASGNFDVFLSALLSLMGWVPAFKGNPLYAMFKRVVLEVAKNRTRPHLVPGMEAMLPGSPMARFLARATPQPGMRLAIVSGDIEGGGWLKRLGVLFTDFTFFDSTDNDLVVDTDAMVGGVARPGTARVLLDKGPEVNHFRYFVNEATRSALRDWLTEASVDAVPHFRPLPGVETTRAPAPRTREAVAATMALPVTVLLPGIMGSHLGLPRRDRIWFDLPDLAVGGLAKLRMAPGGRPDGIEAEALFEQFYGDLQRHLECNQRVVPFPYDWRQPLDVLADRLAAVLRRQLDATASPRQPVRLLAHSMGGLVARALVHRHAQLWDELMAREGARLVMLGTPNQGSHLMVESLIGKSDTVRKLGVLDLRHGLQDVIDIIASFPGALQLLPKPGFADTGSDGTSDFYEAALWGALKREMRDRWFGDGIGALPAPEVLGQARWLWAQDGAARPALPRRHEARVAYVFGCAAKTPCGLAREGALWKMLGTPHGDGSVTWASGRIDGIGQYFYMPAEHGALAGTEAYFDSIASLLERGDGGQLMTSPPALRGGEEAPPVASYDAGPAPFPTDVEVAAGLFGAGRQMRSRERPRDVLAVRVKAMDLRQVTQPILVGHYEQDAISGPEALIDRDLVDGELTVRYHLGLYAGAIGTASAVLLGGTAQERQRGTMRGAVVAGLGKYDGSLSVARLTEAIRTAALRYLIHVHDSLAAGRDGPARDLRLASLLIGYNSSANLTIGDSVQALLQGVADANRHFGEAAASGSRIVALDIVEIYLDSAITATYEARRVAQAMNADPRIACRIEVDPLLHQGEGMRQRLYDGRVGSYWPRLMITDADRHEDECPPEAVAAAPLPDRALADRLRFLYLGQRARAESTLHQRQPGLVERLVERQIMTRAYDADFSRTLFQLLVPHDFKESARQMQQMVFVLDSYTANLPWELMRADDAPLATRTAMVRQLTSTRFRSRVSQTLARRAYVVGNPATHGFLTAFPDPRMPGGDALEDLPAAEKEALAAVDALARHGFDVERAIGTDHRALEVVNLLYRHPYRIVHVAGHGVYEEGHGTARPRSGVVLSDGLMITAAEIDAMEVVPDLVFLNCCHLGRLERSPVPFNKLAHTVARQLIDIGVRAVVVAGWAVEDQPAALFAEVFYEKLLADNLAFGEAVFQARCATQRRHPASITWGAYQAWGDPAWRADPKQDAPTPRRPVPWSDVAPEELLDRLRAEGQEIQRSGEIISPADARRVAARVQQWFAGTPAQWSGRPDLLSAQAALYAELGPAYFAQAADLYRRAVVASDSDGRVPIAAIEQLANVEARLGEATDDADMVARGIERLTQLVRVTTLPSAAPRTPAQAPEKANAERAGLLGSAWKRKAGVHARAYLARGEEPEYERMREALAQSRSAYEAMASKLGDKEVRPYPTLNWLFLWSLDAPSEERAPYVAHVQRCAAAANAAFANDPDAWNSTMVADAALLTALLGDALRAAQGSDAALEGLVASYEEALRIAAVTPRERDSVVQQIRLMATFHAAYERSAGVRPARSVSARLQALARRLGGDVDEAASFEPAPPADASPQEMPPTKARKKARTPPRKRASRSK